LEIDGQFVGFDRLRKLDYGALAESDHLPKRENDSWRNLYANRTVILIPLFAQQGVKSALPPMPQ
jgi:hypothetical protein